METAFIKQSKRIENRQWAAYSFLILNLMIIGFFWWHGSGQEILTSPGGWIRGAGRLSGLLAALAIMLDFVLIARIPVLETAFGRSLQTQWHKTIGYAAFILIILHASFLTVGYGIIDKLGLWPQFWSFTTTYEDVLKSIEAFGLLCLVVGLSIYFVRKRVKYETWYYVHLLTYLVIILAFSHQMKVGVDFITQPLFRLYWWALYIGLFGFVVLLRFMKPILQSYRYQLRVAKVTSETHDVHSITIGGRGIDQLRYQPGQFAVWWFLDTGRFWQGHPFSITSSPGQDHVRLSFKQSGDYTATLAAVKPGTPVILDGPSGRFTAGASANQKVLLIAGGIGITPFVAMLEVFAGEGRDVVLLYSARTEADLALRGELEAAAAQGNIKITYVITDDPAYRGVTGMLDQAKLAQLVPDAKVRAAYICGPPPMMAAISASLEHLGVPKKAIYTENFSF